MSKSITIVPMRLERVINSIKSFPANLKKEMNLELSAAAQEVVTLAARNAPADEAKLRQSIKDRKVGNQYEVAVGASYGPFMEFGTKKKFHATRGFENYAREFKGKQIAGPGGNLFDAILGWVKRKKIKFQNKGKGKRKYMSPEDTAFIIARSIAREGVTPHPFLFPAFSKVRRELVGRLTQIIRRAFK
jgi:hypothetical protein